MQKYVSLLIISASTIGILMRGDGLSAVIDMVALLFVVAIGIGHVLGAKAADRKST